AGVVAVEVGGTEILQRKLRRRGGALGREEALPQQEYERDQREPDDQRDRNADQHPFRIEARRGSGQGDAPDRVGHCNVPSKHTFAAGSGVPPPLGGGGEGGGGGRGDTPL